MRSLAAVALLLAACTAPAPSAAPTSGPPISRAKPPAPIHNGPRLPSMHHAPRPTTTTTAPPVTTTTAPPEVQASTVTPQTTVVIAEPSTPYEPGASVWDDLADCESGNGVPGSGTANWHINTGNGYYGGIQFSLRSWQWVGGTGYPHEHSRETQIAMGERLRARQGWGAWPACSRKMGLR